MRFRAALEARIGEHAATARPIATGMIAGLLAGSLPSKVHNTEYTSQRSGLHMELRLWARTHENPAIWFSPGIHTLPLHRYALCWLRAALKHADRIPRARVV